jgi:tetratricopeptide (TPR) repeat protein
MRIFPTALLLVLAAIPATAATPPPWVEVRSPHFVVITDTNEKQARKLAGQFERMRDLFHKVLPQAGGDASLPITVMALKDRKGFQSLEPASYLAKGSLDLAGLFMRTPDRNYILLRLDTEGPHPYSVVYHEYTHFVLRKAEWLPVWLNEGLAEFYQNTDIDEKGVRLGEPSTNDILYLRQNKLIPLPTLFAVDHDSPYYHEEEKGSVFYSESWALTHFIAINDFDNKTSRLQDYAHLLADNVDPVVAARQAFGDLNQLQKALEGYISNADYKQVVMKSTFTSDDASFQAVPITLSDANAVRADILANNDRRPEAHALLDAVLAEDPKNALAHETMGSLAHRDHDIGAAKKWYGEAVQLNSQSYMANLNFAMFSLMDRDTGNDALVESSLRQAIKLEPGLAPAYDALAHFYAERRRNLDEAHLLSLQAVQIEPEEVRYRINAAMVAMAQQNPGNALLILRAALQVAKTNNDVSMVSRQIQQIQQYQAQLENVHNFERSRASSEAQSEAHAIVEPATTSTDAEVHYPDASPTGPHHTVRGILRAVGCSYPTVLTLTVDHAGKLTSLYSNNYYKIPFSTLNYVPTGDLDPCKGIEGMKASVEYIDVTGQPVAGQIVSIELSK